jgi:hypothetical protein
MEKSAGAADTATQMFSFGDPQHKLPFEFTVDENCHDDQLLLQAARKVEGIFPLTSDYADVPKVRRYLNFLK